jgi:hypothetical protein
MSEPIEEKYHDLMNAMARALDEAFNGDLKGSERHTGFCLFVFPFGEADTNRCNYISNGGDRKDMICLMKEMIARFEGQPEIIGNA